MDIPEDSVDGVDPVDPDRAHQLFVEQVKLLYGRVTLGLTGVAASALVLVVVLRSVVPLGNLFGWLSASSSWSGCGMRW